jgi:cellulose synthase (UDP-forming)
MKSKPHFSVSQQIEVRFNQRRYLRLGVAAIYVAGGVSYLTWRIGIINPDSPLVSWAYYVAEWMGFILGLTVIFSAWRYNHCKPSPARPGLSVDVLIPTYKEPMHVIRRTLMAAHAIRYPHLTWVLDDASRPEIEVLARDLGVRYLARGLNQDAKAGNLNHGLRHSHADFVAVFDADHIAQPHALDTLLGLMTDERVVMVQTPQDYYNVDAFQYLNPRRRAGLWHDQSYFYNLAQSCRDTWNASSCVGTGVLYRRAALDAIGGIPVDTITEDFHTSLKLHKLGWTTRYLNEPVAYGIAATDLEEYYKTRHRWAHGNLAVLRHEHILTCPGLTLKQRLSYLSLGLIYLEGWQQLLLFIVPLFALTLGWAPFEISLFNVLMVLLYPIVGYLLLQEFGCGFSRFWTNEIFAMARWPVHLASAAAIFGKKLPWRSSAKNVQGRISWRLMTPQIAVLTLSALALAYAGWRLSDDFVVGPLAHSIVALWTQGQLSRGALFTTLPAGYSAELVAIAGFWALFNIARVVAFMAKSIRNARRSHFYFRFPLPLPATLAGDPSTLTQTLAIAEDWIRLVLPSPHFPASPALALTLHLPDGPLSCQVEAIRQVDGALEGQLIWADETERDRLAATLYSVDWHRELQAHHAYFLTPSDVIVGLFGQRSLGSEPKRLWRAGILHAAAAPEAAMPLLVGSLGNAPTSVEIISFAPLSSGTDYWVSLPGISAPVPLVVINEVPIASLPHPGLNGKSYARYLATIGTRPDS